MRFIGQSLQCLDRHSRIAQFSAAFHDCFECGDVVFAAVPAHLFHGCFRPVNLGQSSRIDGAAERAVGRNRMSSYHGKGRAGFKDARGDKLAFMLQFL